MHYLVTGGTGFIGSALVESLLADGHFVTVLSRAPRDSSQTLEFIASLDDIPSDGRIDAVVNLAGASLAGARWTTAYKDQIVASRLDTTQSLGALFARLEHPPEVMLSASAIGFYGHHADESLTEASAVVPGFSQQLCARWEKAATCAVAGTETRLCLLRFGVVLDRDGGAMVEMARPFKFGVANWVGDGRQWLSWVHRLDAIAALRFLLQRADLSGPFNITAPQSVTSRDFCSSMKRYTRTLLTAPVPAPVIRLLVGEMAEELLLKGQRVLPARLEAAGFRFQYPLLDDALGAILAR